MEDGLRGKWRVTGSLLSDSAKRVFSLLFSHACRHELFDRNPIGFVRQSSKRRRVPDVLTGAEIKALLESLPLRERTLVLLAASTGLRQGELFGLKWHDIDFERGELNVVRSMVCGVEAAARPSPRRNRFPCICSYLEH
jgi:integrase